MSVLQRADGFVGRHMSWFVLACVALGVGFPGVFAPLSHAAVAMFAFMTFASSLGGGFREMKAVFLHPLPALVTLALLHLALPLAALGLGKLLLPDAPLFITGLVLEFAVPTGVSTLLWVSMGRGNTSLCLSLVLADTLCAPVVVPLTMRLLAGSVVEMDTLGMMKDLLVMVAIPALLAMTLYQATHGRVAETWKPRLAPFSKLAMLLIIVANATGCAPFLRSIDGTLVRVTAAVLALCLLGYLAGYWAARLLKQDFPTVQTITLNTGMRNISAGAVLAAQYFPGDVLFPVAISPIFLQLITAFVVSLLRRSGPGRAFFAQEAAQAADNG